MKNDLFLCNSTYQVMVALWIKYHELSNDQADIIVSNHMNGGEKIAKSLSMSGIFRHVYFAETLDESRYKVKRTRFRRLLGDINPIAELSQYINLTEKYTDLYIANCDGFSQMLYNALNRTIPNLKLHIFEDGLSTYCEFEKYYRYFEHYYYPEESAGYLKKFVREKIYRKKTLFGNVSDFLVFNVDIMKWDPGCAINAITKIDISDEKFREIVNNVFEVKNSTDKYDSKYIFFEESFYADGEKIADVELVEKLAKKVGKNNIMIKIHPRNPMNRFDELGYKTNHDTSIPWEVILMNIGDVSDKVFLTVASSAILNPIMIFGSNITAYSLLPCLDVIPERLKGEAWQFLKEMFEHYPDMITLCDDIDTIK